MDSLKEVVRHTMLGYAGKGWNTQGYLTINEDEQVYAVVYIGKLQDQPIADSGLIVRLVDDKVVIEQDQTDKILMDALIQEGVPRSQIVLAYAGETLDEDERIQV